jgi:hypothetical protein
VEKRRQAWRPREPERVLSVKGPDGNNRAGEFDMRTFIAGTTKIDIIAHISREDLELEGLVLHRFEGSESTANAAFQTLVAWLFRTKLVEMARIASCFHPLRGIGGATGLGQVTIAASPVVA